MPARKGRPRQFGVAVLVCLLVLRACLPPGFMPDTNAILEGRVAIVICTGAGFQSLLVDKSGAPVSDLEPGNKDSPATGCAFGTVLAMALLQPAPGWLVAAPLPAGDAFTVRDPSYVAPSPRGPPVGARAPPYRLG